MSQLCPKQPQVLSQCTPIWGVLGHFFLTHFTVNISKCIQDPQALESLRHFGLPLAQTIRSNWQSLLAGGDEGNYCSKSERVIKVTVKSCYNPLRLGTVNALVSSGIDF